MLRLTAAIWPGTPPNGNRDTGQIDVDADTYDAARPHVAGTTEQTGRSHQLADGCACAFSAKCAPSRFLAVIVSTSSVQTSGGWGVHEESESVAVATRQVVASSRGRT